MEYSSFLSVGLRSTIRKGEDEDLFKSGDCSILNYGGYVVYAVLLYKLLLNMIQSLVNESKSTVISERINDRETESKVLILLLFHTIYS